VTGAFVKSLSSRRRHRFAGAVVLLAALVGTGFVYAALATSSAEAAPSAAPSQTVEEGRQLFLEGCSSCHGLNADGSSDGPTLIGVGAAAVDFQVGTGRMPLARPGAQAPQNEVIYTQSQINALAAYIASLGPGPAIPSKDQLDTSGANLAEGGELFRTNCAQCHNFAGKGGALTHGKYAPALTGVSAKHLYEAMLTGPQNMPVFSDRTITPEQKQAIIKYVQNTESRPNPGGLGLGRVGPVSEGLFGWVVGLGLLGAVAVWIGAKSS
jgi:ubiquinol-cytochrome c reductase cytochrome c subunit